MADVKPVAAAPILDKNERPHTTRERYTMEGDSPGLRSVGYEFVRQAMRCLTELTELWGTVRRLNRNPYPQPGISAKAIQLPWVGGKHMTKTLRSVGYR